MTTAATRAPEPATGRPRGRAESLWVYFLVGLWLGTLFIKSEVASWFRIQEMFRFQAFHMYGVIGSGVLVGAVSVWIMKRLGLRNARGEVIDWPDPEEARPRPNNALGGLCFGLGWGLLGACPGPIFALIGSGAFVIALALLGALLGAWTYGLMKPTLPH